MNEVLHLPLALWFVVVTAAIGAGTVAVGRMVARRPRNSDRAARGVPPQFRHFTS